MAASDRPDPVDEYQHGLQVLARVDGAAGQNVVAALADVAPDMGREIVAWAFGRIYDRPGLTPQQRQLVTLGALTALGGVDMQLHVHIGAALNVGLTRDEIVEVFLHAVPYVGFARAMNAVLVARDVFEARAPATHPSDPVETISPGSDVAATTDAAAVDAVPIEGAPS
jgi:4-carboxymuconolactone decarboxylase